MARQPREASAADVRQWALDENWQDSNGNGVGERGRFSSELVEAFNKAHRRNNVVYPGGNTGNTNSRTQSAPARTQSRASNSGPTTRRPPSRSTQATEAPTRQRAARSAPEDVRTAVITPVGTGLSDEQMRQYSAMLADANAVTGQAMELTIIHLQPSAVA